MICRHWLRVNEANFSNIKRINYWMNIKRLSFSYLDYKLSCFTEVFPFFVQSWKTHISSVIKKHARRRCIASCVETAWNQHTRYPGVKVGWYKTQRHFWRFPAFILSNSYQMSLKLKKSTMQLSRNNPSHYSHYSSMILAICAQIQKRYSSISS